jgi:hypothetical protein
MAHRGQKVQYELVCVLALLSLFTREHLFWVLALLLAFVEIPDFTAPLMRMAGSLAKIAGVKPSPKTAPESKRSMAALRENDVYIP